MDLPAPGADDNGTGTAGLLEIARLVAESGVGFEATIVFASFAAEEFERAGSKAYVDEAIADGDDIRSAVVMDILGYHEEGTTLDISFGPSYINPGTTTLVRNTIVVVQTYFPGIPYTWGQT